MIVQDVSVLNRFAPQYRLIHPPQWRERNFTGFTLVEDLMQTSIGGVMANEKGELVFGTAEEAFEMREKARLQSKERS